MPKLKNYFFRQLKKKKKKRRSIKSGNTELGRKYVFYNDKIAKYNLHQVKNKILNLIRVILYTFISFLI